MQLSPKKTAELEFEPVRGSEVAPGWVVEGTLWTTTVGTVLPWSVTGTVVAVVVLVVDATTVVPSAVVDVTGIVVVVVASVVVVAGCVVVVVASVVVVAGCVGRSVGAPRWS